MTTIHLQIELGTAAAYDKAKRAIADLSDACTLVSSQDVFGRAINSFMCRCTERSALARRLVETGLWEKK